MRRPIWTASVSVLSLATLLASLLLLELWGSRQRELRDVHEHGWIRTQLLDAQLRALALQVDFALQVARQRATLGATEQDLLASQLRGLPEGTLLRAVDAEGAETWRLGSQAVVPASVWVTARPRLRVGEPRTGSIISGPLRLTDGRWVLAYTLALGFDGDRPLGAIQCLLPVAHLQALLERQGGEPEDSFTILSLDLQVVARNPASDGAPVGSRLLARPLLEAIAASPQTGMLLNSSVVDGVERLYTYMRVQNEQLYAISGTGLSDALADWRRTALLYASAALLLLVAGVVGSLWSLRRLGRLDTQRSNRYAELLRTATDGVHILDSSGHLVEASDSFYLMLGYDPRKPPLLSVWAWEHHLTRDQVQAMLNAPAGRSLVVETQHTRRDGSTIDVEIHARGIELQGHKRWYCSARDIGDRKRQEAALQQHQAELAAQVSLRTQALSKAMEQLATTQFAMDVVGIGIHWVHARSGRFLYVNQFAAQMLGRTVDEMLGLSVPEVDPNFSNLDFEHATAGLRTQSRAQFETINLSKDGTPIPIEATVHYKPPSAEGQADDFFVSFVTDISRRKEFEGQLRRAKEAAEQASAAKDEFLANVSHEIRTPLNAILGMAYLLRAGPLTPAQDEQLKHLASAGQHLLELVNSVLDLASIEASSLKLQMQPVNIAELVQRAVGMVAPRVAERPITFQTAIALPHATLMGDETRLMQALLNYLNNAIKFTESGTIAVRVQQTAQDAGRVDLRFAVQDTGVGIAPEALDKLFVPFEQVDSALGRRFGGTGLGLAITRRLARLMDGDAGATSVAGQGSEFWFTCRLRVGDGSEPPQRHDAVPPEELKRRLQGRRVLVVDDDAVNRIVAVSMLQLAGASPEEACDGEEAISLLLGNPAYDLVFMDVQMPGLDGLATTRRLRALGLNLPIVGLSAAAFTEDKTRCLESGMDDFIGKPIDIHALHRTLLRHLPQ